MKLSEQQQKFTNNIGYLILFAGFYGIDLTLGEAHRTRSQILLNYFGYKITKGGVLGLKLVKTRRLSKTLNSLHAERLAIDFNFFIDGELTYDYDKIKPLGEYWEKLDPLNRWGGNFKNFVDTPHFQMNKM